LRTPEIGVRLTLGASPSSRDAVRVLGEGALQAAIGLAIGLGASLALMKGMRTILFGIEPTDPITLVSVGVSLMCRRSARRAWCRRGERCAWIRLRRLRHSSLNLYLDCEAVEESRAAGCDQVVLAAAFARVRRVPRAVAAALLVAVSELRRTGAVARPVVAGVIGGVGVGAAVRASNR
jgi:hypothetical protein